jgi:DNA-binding transcriptional MerR regulator
LDGKAPDAFRTISEAADELDLPQHVLRFWETRFRDIKPMKRGGGRRYYRPDDIDLLRGIRHLLYGEGYTIRGVQRILREQGVRFVQAVWQEGAVQPPHGAPADEAEAEDPEVYEALQERRGLRGRLASLVGRDLDDRQDDAAERDEPPMESVPMPRIEADDRAAHGAPAVEPPRAAQAEPVAQAKSPKSPKSPLPPEPTVPASAAKSAGLAPDDIRKLQSALRELGDCRKLIEAAVARTD